MFGCPFEKQKHGCEVCGLTSKPINGAALCEYEYDACELYAAALADGIPVPAPYVPTDEELKSHGY